LDFLLTRTKIRFWLNVQVAATPQRCAWSIDLVTPDGCAPIDRLDFCPGGSGGLSAGLAPVEKSQKKS
jgi:hypothetical protein